MDKDQLSRKTIDILREVRTRQPVVHHITNFVVMNSTANVTLAVGASPIMAHAREEMEDLSTFADVLNLNIGTLTPRWLESMLIAGKAAGARGIPIVLDPVGSGATTLRTEAAMRILSEVPVTVVRGNASEIMSLFTLGGKVKIRGVDSLETVESVREGVYGLARQLKKVIAVTGEIDFVTNGDKALEVLNGHHMFGRVTGTGCAATTVISCFAAVEPDPLVATAAALGYYGLAGEEAALVSGGPGTFQVALYDALYGLTEETMKEKLRIRPVPM